MRILVIHYTKRNLVIQVRQKIASRVTDWTERLYGNWLKSIVSVQVSILDRLPSSCYHYGYYYYYDYIICYITLASMQ